MVFLNNSERSENGSTGGENSDNRLCTSEPPKTQKETPYVPLSFIYTFLFTAPAMWGLATGISGALSAGQTSYNHFSNAWNTWKYHNADVVCGVCGVTTTQAALDGNSYDTAHEFIDCGILVDYSNGTRVVCQVPYRRCRGTCPNAINHYDTGN